MKVRPGQSDFDFVYSSETFMDDVWFCTISYVSREPDETYRLRDLKELVEDLKWRIDNYDLVAGFSGKTLMFNARLNSCLHYVVAHLDAIK